MASIKLANGTAVIELRIWDGAKWVGKRGRVRNGVSWDEFIRPILAFRDNNVTQIGMAKQLATTLVKTALPAGTSVIPVQSSSGFLVGQQVTITDGVNSESVRVSAVTTGKLTTTRRTKSYKNNASIFRSNSTAADSKLKYPIRATYTIT